MDSSLLYVHYIHMFFGEWLSIFRLYMALHILLYIFVKDKSVIVLIYLSIFQWCQTLAVDIYINKRSFTMVIEIQRVLNNTDMSSFTS